MPPTNRRTVDFCVASARAGPSGVKRPGSMPFGTTCTRSGATPEATKASRAACDGAHTSSTLRLTSSTQRFGTRPNSHG